MVKFPDKYTITAALFLTAAALFVAVPLFIPLADFITTVFVIAGMACAILGCFVLLFSGNEPFDPNIIGLLPVQGCLNQCKMAADAGITGNAYFLPARITGEGRVMQFNPVSPHHWSTNLCRTASDNGMTWDAFTLPPRTSGEARDKARIPHGLMTIPTANPLTQMLKKQNALIIVDGDEELSVLLSEVICGVLEFADEVSTLRENGTVTVTLLKFRFSQGCLYAQAESPSCCIRYPCPTCSLCGTLITECIDKVITLETCSVSPSQDVTAVFSYV